MTGEPGTGARQRRDSLPGLGAATARPAGRRHAVGIYGTIVTAGVLASVAMRCPAWT